MSEKIKVVAYGCGVMGGKIVKALLAKSSFELVGAIDINPKVAGKDVGEVMGLGKPLGIAIESDAEKLFARVKADAVVHATRSYLEEVFPQIASCVKAGLDVVSTCEELSYPWKRNPKRSAELDALCRKNDATVVGTGINPGYLMDSLPLMLTAPCLRVDSIKVTRMMDSSKRRLPFQEKVGTGLTVAEFREKIDTHVITGHVGLLESINMIAAALGWTIDEAVELPPEPIIAAADVKGTSATIAKGRVLGLKSLAHALRKGEKAIQLEFVAHADVREEYDEVVICGEPDIRQRIIGGVHGDIGTVAMIVNAIPRALESGAGLKCMKDLPLMRVVP